MATISHKIKGSFQGALAGGGDPASSPLYVFGPFLKLIVGSGIATITFGASVWLAVLTVFAVSAVYKLVMIWVVDGSGGSGLCEEEFGSWAVKINAAITIIEYTLTFLVSVAALVTFLSDRFAILSGAFLGWPFATMIAVFVSILIGFAVNFGPRISIKIFGPATFGVLILLWLMIGSTIWHLGLHFPPLHLSAFNHENIHFTLAGYARILALMTGIEVFANLVAAYEGTAKMRSKQAFGSLLIIMSTTVLTILIVGPAILQLSDPMHQHVSVFTQTMDKLLPTPLAYMGTFLGVLVLLSAAAASIQGIQNLASGLRYRHYVPAWFGALNHFQVADKPVWLIISLCIVCFIFFGTGEDTYLSLYAVGVFILLSLTSWAAVKRLYGADPRNQIPQNKLYIVGCYIAAILTTVATLIIFVERFSQGAWLYFLLLPIFYFVFSLFRKRLGKPAMISERVGKIRSSSRLIEIHSAGISFENILVPLDQSPVAELALSCAQTIARNYNGSIHLLTILSEEEHFSQNQLGKYIPCSSQEAAQEYLNDVVADMAANYKTTINIKMGNPAHEIVAASNRGIDLLIMTSHARSLVHRWLTSNITTDVIHQTTPPLIVLRPTHDWRSIRTLYKRLLVTLDGSQTAEQVLPYAKELALCFNSAVTLLAVPEASDSEKLIDDLKVYVNKISRDFIKKGLNVTTSIIGTDPAQTIISMSKELNSDLVMMVSHGRGGLKRQEHVKLGSVAETVLQELCCPLFLVSARKS